MSHIVEKIRASGCLSEQELQRQVTMVAGMETLTRLDQWDIWWEEEVKNHVCRLAGVGKSRMPRASDVVVYAVFGLLSFACGVFFLSQIGQGIHDHPFVRWMGGGLIVLGCVLCVHSGRSFVGMRKYKPVLQDYEQGRSGELSRLAPGHRPGSRICLKCLKYTH